MVAGLRLKPINTRNQHEAQVEKEAQVSKPAEEKEYALSVVAGQGFLRHLPLKVWTSVIGAVDKP